MVAAMPAAPRTLDELWQYAVEYLLYAHHGRQIITGLLAAAQGDVDAALRLMTTTAALPYSLSTASEQLGNWGLCCDAARLQIWGNAGSHKLLCWRGPDYWDRPPDLAITWREIFRYVAGMGRQLSFLEAADPEETPCAEDR